MGEEVDPGGPSLLEKARQRAALLGLELAPQHDQDLIPDPEPTGNGAYHDELNPILDGIGIVDAYQRWCGKSQPPNTERTESLKVSCPNPNHPDKNPSAWLNTEKNLWSCGACDFGGDIYDIAAWHFGLSVPGYKTDGTFPELRKRMAESYGYVERQSPTGKQYYVNANQPPGGQAEGETGQETPSPAPLGADPPEDDANAHGSTLAPVVPLHGVIPEATIPTGDIEWRSIIPHDTFFWEWMDVTSQDDLPEEYYFWLGLMAIGLAAGREVILQDRKAVLGNLFVCLVGPSGVGKSRAVGALNELLDHALPFDPNDVYCTGVKLLGTMGSAESLIDSFCKPEYDPTDPSRIVGYRPVRGLVKFEELANFIGHTTRQGNTIKPTLMEFFDGNRAVEVISRSHGRSRAEMPFCSLATTTQPLAIRKLLIQSDVHSGFINRFIFAFGQRKELSAWGGVTLDLDEPIRRLQQLRTWCSGRQLIPTQDALNHWERFFREEIVPLKTPDFEERSDDVLSRMDLILKKLMLLFAINDKSDAIRAEHVERALALFPALLAGYTFLGRQIGIGDFEETYNTVGETLQRLQDKLRRPVSLREIHRALPRGISRELVLRVIKTMNALGDLDEEITQGKRGPVTIRYRWAT